MSAPYRPPQYGEEAGEEYRRSAQGPPYRAAGPPPPPPPGVPGRPRQVEQHPGGYPMGPMDGAMAGAAPYYRQPHPSAYGRPPYMGGQGGYGGVHSPNDFASMYGRRAAGQMYGYPPPQGSGTSPGDVQRGYGHPPPYGMPHASAEAYAQYYGRHDMYAQRPHDGMVPHHHNPYGPQSSPNQPSPNKPSPNSRGTPPGMPGSAGSKGHSGEDDEDRNENGSHSGSGSDNEDEDDENEENQADGQKWFHGSVPLGLEDDKYWLSELQVYLRSNFAESFGATEEDIAAPMHGRNKPIAFGQVGIRCMHCKHDNPAERGQQATSYPSLISGIYNSVQQMLRLHLDCCLSMPPDVRQKIEQLKLSSSSRGGRKQYWIDSAKRLGLVDTPHGIHFGRDPTGPLPPLTGPSVNSKEGRKKKQEQEKTDNGEEIEPVEQPIPEVDPRPLVFEEDQPLISDFLYLTLEQMSPCKLMEADRVGCYKTRKVGFPGLACRHCVGQAGCGRYFPASEASLSQTTTSQTIMNHVRNCRRCPVDIRENLEIMKRARMGPDGKRADKPKHGGRKVFFHRLWCRIQGLPIEEKGEPMKEPPAAKKKKPQPAKRAKKKTDSDESEGSGEETEEEEGSDPGEEKQGSPPAKSSPRGSVVSPKKPAKIPWFEGCVRLTKSDDPKWVSEMECFARSDLVEVFSLRKEDSLEGYNGKKEPSLGQVGVRCVFCKDLDPDEQPLGCVQFPDSSANLHNVVGDMIRFHFPSCPRLPDDKKEKFRSLKGFDAKTAGDDAQQYWIDSARDIGLCDLPQEGPYAGWGIAFRRDPLEPSPADDLDREMEGEAVEVGKSALVKADEDKGTCTDQVMLLLRNVKPCRFDKSDRRGGPGARGRDRVAGFPGLSCKHCKNGRYFPVSAKNLTDSTANSLVGHVAGCAKCPEPIKASLAYLTHRSVLQKAELGGSWKKTFFKKVWDRLHSERAWEGEEEEVDGKEGDEAGSVDGSNGNDGGGDDGDPAAGNGGGDSETEDEELGEGMENLIAAAAIWLTEQETTDGGSRGRSSSRRGLPNAKRPASSPKGGGGGGSASKRRRTS
ncbi:expressed unknown protein [Seminavis robusta]|uniref:Uncharacterized protein n=1 Tax=Seminavis robusta TaxID=568900 RepID=A0A9N8DUG5_9STRA|nr:expressed unknown protein [Seminavis robusta]|eukprot:Sro359_g126150.1 n/a (1071) ;mRNA; f:56257-59772